MQARVKANSWIHIVTACAGTEFVQYEWRRVPDGGEDEVKGHNLLDWRDNSVRKAETKDTLPLADADGYDHMTDDQLKEAAKTAGIPNYWSKGRAKLIAELEAL